MSNAALVFHALFDASPNPYLALDRGLNIVGANRAYLESTKRDLADIVGRCAWDAFPTDSDTLEQAIASFERVIRTKRPDTMALLRFDVPRPEAEGGGFEERYWSITHTPVLDPQGDVAVVLQHPIDVTELNLLREAASHVDGTSRLADAQGGIFARARTVAEENLTLKAESDRLRDLFVQAPGFMAILRGPDHRFELTNCAYVRLIGGRQVVGLTVRQALGDLDDQMFFDLLDSVHATGEPYVGREVEIWIEHEPGSPKQRRFVDFVYQPILGRDGTVSGIFVEGNDVTETKAAVDDLREREQRLRVIVEAATDYAILTVDADHTVTSWSAGAAAIFGFDRDEIVGQPFEILFTPEDREAGQPGKEIEGARQVGGAPDVRWHQRKDGGRVFLNGVVRPLRDVTGREIGFLKIARDETERLANDRALRLLNTTLESRVEERSRELLVAEEAMRQSQKMEAVGQLTGGVAHDFNNLLTIIRSSVDLLRRPDLSDDRRRRYIDAVSDTVDRAAKLTGQLLAFARRQALKPEVFDVGARLKGVGEMLDTITGARIRVVTELPDTPCFVKADLSQFETALVNMAVNARDAMDGDGVLSIRLRCGAAMPPIRGHAGAAGPFAAVSITDTGTGIEEDKIARIFEPFFTTKGVGKGTGLGLSQVFGFTKQSGGDVDVESEVGEGTTFTLYLPEVESDAAPARADRGSDVPSPGGAGRRVLVVEDNIEVGRFSTQVLQDLGYETTWAANAEEALDRIGEHGADFDVVFSDVVMPGMGGIELAKQLRRRLPDLPIVLASGYSHVLAEEGPHGFDLLHKPYSAEQLSSTLRRVPRRRRPEFAHAIRRSSE
ncbi:PAS domain-containing protein [Lichenihabitans sp. Uapishka_5]|uniref:PAS domain-containing protein n=1 Tax=Lichenihabitans sp. Uapishka_5 TaxID=3037302 RepID=UPI0029E8168D|nr:PAS domain-containing protein [Lichenihabitans sp. Uapishka_5]MDX7952296.1 PAS domain-containing protein [Lichenihabitans sp. Uapishka_5]